MKKHRSLLKRLNRLWHSYILRRTHISYALWHEVVSSSLPLSRLDHHEHQRLRELTSEFLYHKSFSAADDLVIDPYKQVYIASHACLLILNLGLDYYAGWREIIVYPSCFITNRDEYDSAGVAHRTRKIVAGESWQRGPVILSWQDIDPTTHPHTAGTNVILHEFAHKLDMLNGSANGMPPLHHDMIREQWTNNLSEAFNRLRHQLERHHRSAINAYAAESPGEFFAVLTEVFFEQPKLLNQQYPEVYQQLQLFYRQDPLGRADRH